MRECLPKEHLPDHVALAYGSWAPLNVWKKGDDSEWLNKVAQCNVTPDYKHAFGIWKASFAAPDDHVEELALSGRLLVGHGNPSPTEVGITVHHSWGVPIIPGSALKGLAAHYLDANYGPGSESAPWKFEIAEDKKRANYAGVTYDKNRIMRGPGEHYRALFGAPEAEQDAIMRQHDFPAGAIAGLVTFHDALYIPGSAPREQGAASNSDAPFAVDVLTVHQRRYYEQAGRHWPCDYDDPNPVGFLTVRPGAKFHLALSGPPAWTKFALRLLSDALQEWGVGGKTAAGYGHGAVGQPRAAAGAAAPGNRSAGATRNPIRGDRVRSVENPARLGKIVADGRGFPRVWRIEWDGDLVPKTYRRELFELIG